MVGADRCRIHPRPQPARDQHRARGGDPAGRRRVPAPPDLALLWPARHRDPRTRPRVCRAHHRPAARRHPAGPGPLRHHHDVQQEPPLRRLVHVLGLPGARRRRRRDGLVRFQRLGSGRDVGGHPHPPGVIPVPPQRRRPAHHRRRRAGRGAPGAVCAAGVQRPRDDRAGPGAPGRRRQGPRQTGQRPSAAPGQAPDVGRLPAGPGHLHPRRGVDCPLRRGGGRRLVVCLAADVAGVHGLLFGHVHLPGLRLGP